MRAMLKLTSIFMMACSIPMFCFGYWTADIGTISGAVFLIWGAAILDSFSQIEKNVIYICFLFTFFIFLLSRVMVRYMTNGEVYMPFDQETMKHIYLCLFLSIGGLYIGMSLRFKPLIGKFKQIGEIERIDMPRLRNIAMVMAVISGVCQLMINIEKFAYWSLLGNIRLGYSSALPSIVVTFSYLYVFFLCIYLATYPRKKDASLMLLMYIAICAIKMLFGSRCDFILGLMFVLVYFVIRDRLEWNKEYYSRETWIGKKEILVIIISIPLLIILVVFVGYYRTESTFKFTGLWDTLLDFFESQGTSIDVLGYAYQNEDKLTQPHYLYLFDNLYSFITTNPISRLFFGTESYSVNTVERAIYGTSLDQSLYYIINPSSYLNGNGCGSSYVAEAYLAFGYAGTFLVSAVVGGVMRKLNEYEYDSMLKNVVAFIFIQSLFFIPRAGFDDYLGDFLSFTHIVALVIMWMIYHLLGRKQDMYTGDGGFLDANK